jgi:hypothetical protein
MPMQIAVTHLAAGASFAQQGRVATPRKLPESRANSLTDNEIEFLTRFLSRVDALVLERKQCDWRIAQAGAYLASPRARNVSLGAIRLAELKAYRERLIEQWESLKLEEMEIRLIP